MAREYILMMCLPLLATGLLEVPQSEMIFYHGGYTFEFHPYTHLLTMRNVYNCYFMTTTSTIEKMLVDRVHRLQLQDEILKRMHNKQGITKTSLVMAEFHHRDGAATTNCIGRDLYELRFPSLSY